MSLSTLKSLKSLKLDVLDLIMPLKHSNEPFNIQIPQVRCFEPHDIS